MPLIKFQLPSKLLSITNDSDFVYIGSFTGQIYILKPPYSIPTVFLSINEPISSIDILNKTLIIGTWSGNVYHNEKHVKNLGRSIIKAIKVFDDKILVSQDSNIFILDSNFQTIKKIDLKCKILCFCIFNGDLYAGTNKPQIIKFQRISLHQPVILQSTHSTSILDICLNDENHLVTCSADKTIRKNGSVIYEGCDWIYAVTKSAFGDGRCLYINNKKVFEHNDVISGIIEFNGRIASIGLDGQIVMYSENIECTAEEDEELRLLNEEII